MKVLSSLDTWGTETEQNRAVRGSARESRVVRGAYMHPFCLRQENTGQKQLTAAPYAPRAGDKPPVGSVVRIAHSTRSEKRAHGRIRDQNGALPSAPEVPNPPRTGCSRKQSIQLPVGRAMSTLRMALLLTCPGSGDG